MSRIVLCLRVVDRPIPHVESVIVTCATCQCSVWRDANAEPAPFDVITCTACYPGYDLIKQAVHDAMVHGVGEINPTPAQAHDLASKLTDLFRTMAKPYVDAAPTEPAINGKPGKGSN